VLALKVNLVEIDFLCFHISLEESLLYIHANSLHGLGMVLHV
jgi:hypothetical protein